MRGVLDHLDHRAKAAPLQSAPSLSSHFSLFPRTPREAWRIAGGKRFLEGFVYFFFQMPIFIVHFPVRSIRAHGIGSTTPHPFRLQSVCFFLVSESIVFVLLLVLVVVVVLEFGRPE